MFSKRLGFGPVLISVVVVLLFCVLMIWGSLTTVTSHYAIYIRFDDSDSSSPYAYLIHEAPVEEVGFRDPEYPLAEIKIRSENREFAPARRGSRVHMAVLRSNSTISIQIKDGTGKKANRKSWYFPKFVPDVFDLENSLIDWEQFSAEEADSLRNMMGQIPEADEPIEEPRRSELVGMMIEALRDGEHGWIADAVLDGQSQQGGLRYDGFLKLAIIFGVILLLLVLVEWFRVKNLKGRG